MRVSVARVLRTLGMFLFGLSLLPSTECTNAIFLELFPGFDSYLPEERPSLECYHENVSDTGNAAFFHNGTQIQNGDDYHIWECRSPPCPMSSVLILGFADHLSGNYTCSVTSGNQVFTSNTLSIASASNSVVITNDSALPLGGDIQLSCVLNSERTDVVYNWTLPDGLSTVSGQLLNLTNVTSKDAGKYTCEITSPIQGSLTTEVLVEVVDKAPVFDNTKTSVQVERHMTAIFNCSPESAGPTSYLWYRNEDLITNSSKITINPSGNTLTIAALQYSSAGIYICRATNLFGHSNKTWNLTVVGPPIFSVSGSEFQLLEGASITLPCNQTSVPDANIVWQQLLLDQDANESQTIPLTGKFSVGPANELVINEVEFDDSGYYTCIANNRYGSGEIEYQLIIDGKPESPIGLSVAGPASTSSVNITWFPYFSAERRSADILVLELTDNEGSTYSEYMTIDTVAVNRALVVGLNPNTMYKLRLVAENQVGKSSPSNEVEFQTAIGVPRLESVVVRPVQGGRSILIEWIVEYTGGSPITELYALITSQDGSVQRINLNIGSTSQEISGLEPLTGYTVSLHVANEAAMKNLMPQSIVTTRGPPGAPTKPVILDSNTSSATIQVIVTSPGSEPITYFLLNISENTVFSGQLVLSVDNSNRELGTVSETSSGVFELLIASLSSSYFYSFSVAAGGQIGHGEFSEYSDDVEIGTVDQHVQLAVAGTVEGVIMIIMAIIISATVYAIYVERRRKLKQITFSATRPIDLIWLSNLTLSKDQHSSVRVTEPHREFITEELYSDVNEQLYSGINEQLYSGVNEQLYSGVNEAQLYDDITVLRNLAIGRDTSTSDGQSHADTEHT